MTAGSRTSNRRGTSASPGTDQSQPTNLHPGSPPAIPHCRLDDWRTILEAAGRFATNCGAAYRYADPPTRELFNNAVIDRIELRDGQIAHVDYRAPFDLLFNRSGFEYRAGVEHSMSNSNPDRASRTHLKSNLGGRLATIKLTRSDRLQSVPSGV
jgi:hypothetical protein